MSQDTSDEKASNLNSSDELDLTAISSPYKVLGDLSDPNGIGVLGRNTATSGTTKGLEGRVDSSDGYGLYTPDDAKIKGVTELGTLAGSLTGGTEMSNIVGQNLSIDGDGNLNSHTYKTNTFTTDGTTWDAITGLSEETEVEVTVDTNAVTGGKIAVEVDGSLRAEVGVNEVFHRLLGAKSSVAMRTEGAWTLSDVVFDTSFDVASADTGPHGLAFRSDGTKMFVIGNENDNVYSYTLSTAWDLSTATFNTSFDVSSEDTFPQDVSFKSDGTKMFVSGRSNVNIYSYNLSTAWDLSTASFDVSFDVGSEDSYPTGVAFQSDGTKMFVIGAGNNNVYSYTLSTAWDLSTASFDVSFDVGSEDGIPQGLAFRSDGTKMFVIGDGNDNVYSYILSTAWDLTTATFEDLADVSGEDSSPTGVTFQSDGTKMFVIGNENDNVYSYKLKKFDGTGYAAVKTE